MSNLTIDEYLAQYGPQIDEVVEKVRVLKKALPETSDEIAEMLKVSGIKAVCGDPNKCALAEYFRPALPIGWVISVDGEIQVGPASQNIFSPLLWEQAVGDYDDWEDVDRLAARHVVGLSAGMEAFINAFDLHVYPDLEIETVDA